MSRADREHPVARPSMRRRILAGTSLLCFAAATATLVGLLVREPQFLVGAVVGLLLVGGGGWWAATEQSWRRLVGLAATAVGVVVIVWAFVSVYSGDRDLWRLGVVGLLLAAAVGCARAALVKDLHEIDRIRQHRVSPRSPVLICNPKSGGGKVEKFGLVDLATGMGVEVVTLEPGSDLAQLARDAIDRGADCIGMAGGDGSQALVASIAIERGIPFVCISAGTRNHFALDLGLDRDDPRTGLVALRDGVERCVDYATVGDRLFVNNVSLGVYATIVQEDEYRDAKRETTTTKLPELLGRQAEPFDLQLTTPEGQEVDGAFLIMVSNNPYVYGPALDIAQRRSMDSGRLGVLAVTATTGAEAARLVARATLGRGTRDPNLVLFDTDRVEVRSRSGRALAGIDGEALDLSTPLDFRIHPRGLRILVPPDSVLIAERRRARNVSLAALWRLVRGKPAHVG